MYLKKISLSVYLIVLAFSFYSCEKESEPVAAQNQTYEMPFGVVSQIDDYPLFTLNYSSDYKFDEYLLTGNMPLYTANYSSDAKFSCTCFSAFGADTRLLGRNYDWVTKATYFIVFTDPPDGYASVATVDLGFFNYHHDQPPTANDNLTILRSLPYYPFDGMNEQGVAVGMNALNEAQAPYDPSKTTIGELQFIRLVLDYAASTQEALNLIQHYNIRMEEPPIHYLIADSSGHSVIIEFVDGKMEIMHNTNAWQVTTNFVITGLIDPEYAPCWRYKTAYQSLSQNKGCLAECDAVGLLQSVSVSNTRWSNVFNLKSREIQVAMGRDYANLYNFTIPH